jgi:hypothetical protein
MKSLHFTVLPVFVVLLLAVSCTTMKLPPETPHVPVPPLVQIPSGNIAGHGIKNVDQLTAFFLDSNSQADRAQVQRMAQYYIEEGAAEDINSDVAWTQMCLETGFLRFGGLVTSDMHNYCGLGAIDAAHPGERFPTEQIGVRAHIQHLHAYGTTSTLRQPLVDNRYRYVNPRGKAPDIYSLAGTWASDKAYGEKLDKLLSNLARY